MKPITKYLRTLFNLMTICIVIIIAVFLGELLFSCQMPEINIKEGSRAFVLLVFVMAIISYFIYDEFND